MFESKQQQQQQQQQQKEQNFVKFIKFVFPLREEKEKIHTRMKHKPTLDYI
jgi:hypothetical protein